MLNRFCIRSTSILGFVIKSDTHVCTNYVNTSLRNCKSLSSSQPKFTENLRVRFAPSPTGYLHLGGLRTALYNYLAAAAQNGTFILRIEDTDSNRFVPGAAEALLDVLKWARLMPHEGYGIGGPRGPYLQSGRKHLYQKYALELINQGAAYRCFCSPLRLELLRKRGGKSGSPVPYDNKCRSLTKAKAEEILAQGLPFCIRLKLEEIGPWEDTVYGSVPYDLDEADPVILKTDGQATYHLANVVDDHLMAITHVIRGDEWLRSTPKHLLMYQALGWSPPSYAHLPLLLNTDGSKLSKRQDNLRVEQLRRCVLLVLVDRQACVLILLVDSQACVVLVDRQACVVLVDSQGCVLLVLVDSQACVVLVLVLVDSQVCVILVLVDSWVAGYSARTLINLVLGTAVQDRDQQVVYSLDELVDKFSLSHVTKRHTMVDLDRLCNLGQQDFLRSVQDAAESPSTVQVMQDMIRDAYGDSAGAETAYVRRVLQAFTSRPVERLTQLLDPSRSYLWQDPPPLQLSAPHLLGG
ncbi:Glutamate-tRNA ligase bacterial/mitochondrial [Trinorchestia longiramus]|nr:Glutamate-tRNA ligase bacterial/mitochondrial [Trinorchestia longiramus]